MRLEQRSLECLSMYASSKSGAGYGLTCILTSNVQQQGNYMLCEIAKRCAMSWVGNHGMDLIPVATSMFLQVAME